MMNSIFRHTAAMICNCVAFFCCQIAHKQSRFCGICQLRSLKPRCVLMLSLIHILIHITQFKNLPIRQIWTDMCSPLPPWLPIWFPINVTSEIAGPISLSLRLFANVLSGTVMMALVYGLLSKIAIIWPAALHAVSYTHLDVYKRQG